MLSLKDKFIDVSADCHLNAERALRQTFANLRADREADPWSNYRTDVIRGTTAFYSAIESRRMMAADEYEEQYRRFLLNLIFGQRPYFH